MVPLPQCGAVIDLLCFFEQDGEFGDSQGNDAVILNKCKLIPIELWVGSSNVH